MLDKQPQIEQLKPLLRKVIEILGEDPDREGLKPVSYTHLRAHET